MDPHRSTDDPDLDALLDASRPPTPRADATPPALLLDAVARTRARAAATPRPPRRRLHGQRSVAGAAVVVLAVAGAGAAAAVTQPSWAPWAQVEPVGVFTYTLPSGAVCEQRIGAMDASAEVVAAAEEYFATHDVLALADVDGEIARMRADDEMTQVLTDGTVVPSGYGTAYYYSPDTEYDLALSAEVGRLLGAELERQGLSGEDVYRGYQTEGACPGAQW